MGRTQGSMFQFFQKSGLCFRTNSTDNFLVTGLAGKGYILTPGVYELFLQLMSFGKPATKYLPPLFLAFGLSSILENIFCSNCKHSDVTVKSRALFDRAKILPFFVIRGLILPGFDAPKNNQNVCCGALEPNKIHIHTPDYQLKQKHPKSIFRFIYTSRHHYFR